MNYAMANTYDGDIFEMTNGSKPVLQTKSWVVWLNLRYVFKMTGHEQDLFVYSLSAATEGNHTNSLLTIVRMAQMLKDNDQCPREHEQRCFDLFLCYLMSDNIKLNIDYAKNAIYLIMTIRKWCYNTETMWLDAFNRTITYLRNSSIAAEVERILRSDFLPLCYIRSLCEYPCDTKRAQLHRIPYILVDLHTAYGASLDASNVGLTSITLNRLHENAPHMLFEASKKLLPIYPISRPVVISKLMTITSSLPVPDQIVISDLLFSVPYV